MEQEHIAWHHVRRWHGTRVAIAQHACRGPDEARERMQRVFCLAFSDIPNSGIEGHHTGDHHGVGHAARQEGDTGRNSKEGYGERGKLPQENAETGTRHSCGWEVRSVTLEALLGRSLGEPDVLCRVEGRTTPLGRHDVPWHLGRRVRLPYCPPYRAPAGHCCGRSR